MSHTVLTFVAEVDAAKLEQLQALLIEIADDVTGNPHVPFPALTKLHFASLVIFPDELYGPYLVFENNFDGPLGPYLDELLESAAEGLHRILGCCLGYRATGANDRAAMRAYLRSHVVRPSAYHIGNVGRSVARIAQEQKLRDELERFLDGLVQDGRAGTSPSAIRRRIMEFVDGDARWAWVRHVRPRLTFAERLVPRARLVGAGLGALALSPVLLPVGLAWALVLRWHEARDSVWSGLADHEHLQKLQDQEDRPLVVQNHMVNLSHVKPGRFRRFTLRLVLWFANLRARTQTNGTLGGIPSIHFAHWSQIDNGRRLLFLSNYDGSWENYLDDFIDKASRGLTAIWSHTVEFPRTRWLVKGGAEDGPNFKAIARARQVPTNVWYSAYPDLTVQQIDKNSTIREQLFAPLDETAERAWLRSF